MSATLVMLWSSCERKPLKEKEEPIDTVGRQVLILNEGSYGNGNASLSLYNITTGDIAQNIYEYYNNNEILGDILQSAVTIDNRIFLTINNSNKIVVIDKTTFKKIATIELVQPRYILPISEELAYVSTIYHSKIHIINTQTYQVVGSITMPYPNTENMLLDTKGFVYVCNWDKANNKLYQINANAHTITDSIVLAGNAPHSILTDKENNMWVFGGNKVYHATSTISVIQDNKLHKSYTFPQEAEIVKPVYNSRNDRFYFINVDYEYKTTQGIYSLHTDDESVPGTPLIPTAKFQYFYHITLDTATQQLYISDPKGFIQNGDILIYNLDGVKQHTIPVGMGPNQLLFL
jgi:DNA-binding beta-propeller fold protein YncE